MLLVAAEAGGAGAVAGCIGLKRKPGAASAELVRMAVRPDARGSGIGALLMRAFEAHARGLGARSAWLVTANPRSAAFYARHGFARSTVRSQLVRLMTCGAISVVHRKL